MGRPELRPVYRLAWPVERGRVYVRDQTGQHFDPQVVEAFLIFEADGRQTGRWPNEA